MTVEATTVLRSFNINGYARFKPSPAVINLWRARQIELRAAYPKMAMHLEMPLDADGFYRGQLWHIIALIAPECVAGGSVSEGCLLFLEFTS